jgi:sulfite exporter TauE/SafE
MDLLWTALLVGFVGSLHCGVMCGPLVLAVSRASRVGATQLAYHTGRIATYCSIGLVLGALGSTLAFAGFQRWLSIAAGVLILAALFWTMAMFGLGTIPMLTAVSLLGPRISLVRKFGPTIIPISLAIVGAMLLLRGLAIGIPYLSPSSTISCH